MSNTNTDGKIPLTWAAKSGEYVRQESIFRNKISSETGAKFPPENGRYILYVSHACPWAHRAVIFRKMKGLEDVIDLSVVHYLLDENGWHFDTEGTTPGCIPDTVNNSKFIRELYFRADPEYKGRFTVPLLWDKKLNTAVNNESAEIIRMLNSEFNAFAKNPKLDLCPKDLLPKIDEVNAWVYDSVNNGVYKTGFATTQEAYEKNCKLLFEGLDKLENILTSSKFLIGDKFTEADVRCFTTIVRFDPVYHGHFKCNKGTIEHDYPNILRWAKDVYQLDGGKIAETVNMEHIKKHYYMSHIKINPNRIVGLSNGPDLSK